MLNKTFLKVKPNRKHIENFRENLIQLLDMTNDAESEEFHKNLFIDPKLITGSKKFMVYIK